MIDKAHRLMLVLLREKTAGAVSKALKEGASGYFGLGKRMAETAAEHGAGPLTQAAFHSAPYVGALVGGKAAWESDPALRVRRKMYEMKMRRRMRQMRGG